MCSIKGKGVGLVDFLGCILCVVENFYEIVEWLVLRGFGGIMLGDVVFIWRDLGKCVVMMFLLLYYGGGVLWMG